MADWLQKVEGLDLGEYGFLRHIALYFGREYAAAADGLSSYLEEVGGFSTNEYDTVIGRIFLNALYSACRSSGTLEALRRLEEITTLLVHDERLDDAGRQTFLIDRKGVMRYRNLRGAELERRVRELIAEPPE